MNITEGVTQARTATLPAELFQKAAVLREARGGLSDVIAGLKSLGAEAEHAQDEVMRVQQALMAQGEALTADGGDCVRELADLLHSLQQARVRVWCGVGVHGCAW